MERATALCCEIPRIRIRTMQRKPYVLILLIALLAATGSAGALPLQQQPEAASQSKSVVNLLVPTEGHQVIMLQVRFAEVDRAALSQLGMNIFSTGAANTPGAISTQQFGALGGLSAKGAIPGELKGTSTTFGLTDLLNVFVFRPDLNLGVTI